MQSSPQGLLAELQPATKRAIVFIATIQGVLLLGMHELLVREWWPATSIPLRTLWYTLALTVPTAIVLLIRDLRDRRLWLMIAAYAVLLVPAALYTGSQYLPEHHTQGFRLFATYALSQAAIWFVVTYLIDLKLDGESLRHSRRDVCAYTWKHGLALALLGFFLGLLWTLLTLWGALFKVLDIGFFQELFQNRRFIYPAFGLAGGFAVTVLRGQIDAVGLLERIASALLRVLLPLLALIVLLFLCALPFSGVQLLWKAGLGTALMMWLICLMLMFVNVAFFGTQARYPVWLRLPIYLAVALLPVYLGLCVWGISLRIGEHGWSYSRLLVVLIQAILAIFVLCYSAAVVLRRERWLESLPPINRIAGCAAAVLLFLTCLPLLNLEHIAARDLVARLVSGKTDVAQADYRYLRFDLDEPGYRELTTLKASSFAAAHPVELAKMDGVLASSNRWGANVPAVAPMSPADLAKAVDVAPQTAPVPPDLLVAVAADKANAVCFAGTGHCEVVGLDLRGDGGKAYILLTPNSGWYPVQPVYALDGGKWRRIAGIEASSPDSRARLKHALETGAFKLERPEFPDLVVGNQRFQVHRP
ncbi:MAG TPA: DUF4153 domain-containing protein [Gammaproteobacteria bacterium]|nr:DUF4153 domain-containing protein [Gammaproteobacteria bacterium]